MTSTGTSWFRRTSILLAAALVAIVLNLVVTEDAKATGYVVTSLADDLVGAVADDGTLRGAILAANGNGGVDSITFSVTGTIALAGTLPAIAGDTTISGPGAAALTIDGGAAAGSLVVTSGTVAISGLRFANGTVAGAGGAIRNLGHLTVVDTVFEGNSASTVGGAIASDGPLVVQRCSFSGGSANFGGAIYTGSSSATIDSSTFDGNTAGSTGGAVHAMLSTTTIETSTFSANTAGTNGSAVSLTMSPTTIRRSTITGGVGNSAIHADGPLTITGSIVAGNGAMNGTSDISHGALGSTTATYSVLGGVDGTGVTTAGGNQIGVHAPLLSALADNGGTTKTMPPLPGSPAIDRGDPLWSGTPATDQRGQPRRSGGGGAVDVGAVETPFSAPALPTTIGSNLAAMPTAQAAAALTVEQQVSHTRAAGGLTAPASGVVVRWRVKTGATAAPTALRIMRAGGLGRGPVASSAVVTPPVNAVGTFDTRLAVAAGDGIGVDINGFGAMFAATATPSALIASALQLADGATAAPITQTSFELLVNADIEPDADGDGWGDTTQDRCVGAAGTSTGCAPAPSGGGAPPPAPPDIDVDVFDEAGENLDADIEIEQLDPEDLGDAGNGVDVLDAYDIEVTNDDTDHARICIPYDEAAVDARGLDEHDLELFHLDGDERDVITTELDTVDDLVCGETTSFSPFAIGVLNTDRVDDDPVAIAALASKETFESGVGLAYLVGVGSSDALGVGPVAALRDAPVLVTGGRSLSEATRAELERLRPRRVAIVGGTGVIGDAVASQVAAMGPSVVRVAGVDRFATSVMLAAAFDHPEVAYVVAGSLADGAVGGAAAAHDAAPLLLTSRDALPAVVRDELTRLAPDRIVVVGGRASVSDAVLTELSALVPRGARRLAGSDRIATSGKVLARSFPTGSPVVVASATAPGLSAAVAVAGMQGAALVLVGDAPLPISVRSPLTRIRPRTISVVGSRAAVSVQMESDLALLLGGAE